MTPPIVRRTIVTAPDGTRTETIEYGPPSIQWTPLTPMQPLKRDLQQTEPCLFEGIPDGTMTGIYCSCPKCSWRFL